MLKAQDPYFIDKPKTGGRSGPFSRMDGTVENNYRFSRIVSCAYSSHNYIAIFVGRPNWRDRNDCFFNGKLLEVTNNLQWKEKKNF